MSERKSGIYGRMKNVAKQFVVSEHNFPLLSTEHLNYRVKHLRDTHFSKARLSETVPLRISVSAIVHLQVSSPAGIQGVMMPMPTARFQGLVSFHHFNSFLSSISDSWSHSSTKALVRVVDFLSHKPIGRTLK